MVDYNSAYTGQEIDDTVSVVAALRAGATDFIERKVLSSVATADFTGFDSSKYDSYLFTFGGVLPSFAGADLYARTSTNGGSSYDAGGADYAYAGIESYTSGSVAGVGNASTQSIKCGRAMGTSVGLSGGIQLNYPHLVHRTQVSGYGTWGENGSDIINHYFNGERLSAGDVDAIRFLMSTSSIASGTITMYGRKNT